MTDLIGENKCDNPSKLKSYLYLAFSTKFYSILSLRQVLVFYSISRD